MAIPLIAAALYGMAGHQNYKERERQNARQDVLDARAEKEYARKEADWKEQDQLKQALKEAGSMVTMQEGSNGMIKPEFMDNRDVGLAENQTLPNNGLLQGQYKVKDQTFTDKAVAEKAVADLNAPKAVVERTAQALRQHGKLDQAMTMENLAIEQQAKKLGLDVDQVKHARVMYNDKLTKSLGSKGNAEDGIAHTLSVTEVVLPGQKVVWRDGKDGQADYFAVGEDGTEKKVLTLPKGPAGKAEFLKLAASATPEEQIRYITEGEKIKKDEERYNSDRALKEKELELKRQQIANEEKYRTGQLSIQANKSAGRGVGEQVAVGLKERRELLADFGQYLPKAPEEGGEKIQASNTQALGQADAIFSSNAKFGSVLTAPQVMNAMRLATDPKNVRIMRDNNTGAEYETVNVNGSPVIIGIGKTKPIQNKETELPQKPVQQPMTMQQAAQTSKINAPLRSIDGGKTYTLDVPKTIRDPSVKYYREIPNPAYDAVGTKSFSSAAEARAAYEALQK